MMKQTLFALALASFGWTAPHGPAGAAPIELGALKLTTNATLFSYEDTALFGYVNDPGFGLTIFSVMPLLGDIPYFAANGLAGDFLAFFDDGSIAFSGTDMLTGSDVQLIEVLFEVEGQSPFGAPFFLMSLFGPGLGDDPSPLLGLTGPEEVFGFAGLRLTAVEMIPLPAGLLLLLSATGALALLCRRGRHEGRRSTSGA